jgi:hypothetical protein
MKSWRLITLGVALIAACTPPAAVPTPPPTVPAAIEWPRVSEDDDELLPPIARLLADGSVQAGALGSFAYRDAAADSPWLSSGLTRLAVPADEQLTVALLPGSSFEGWQASYAAAADSTGEVVHALASGSGESLERASFDPPPSGEWVIRVSLTFPDGDGDATYYWLVSVP